MSCPPTPVLPAGPLLDLIARRAPREHAVSTLARLVGRHRHTVRRWVEAGVPVSSADVAAVRLGYHPSAIWPEWWDLPTLEDDADVA